MSQKRYSGLTQIGNTMASANRSIAVSDLAEIGKRNKGKAMAINRKARLSTSKRKVKVTLPTIKF